MILCRSLSTRLMWEIGNHFNTLFLKQVTENSCRGWLSENSDRRDENDFSLVRVIYDRSATSQKEMQTRAEPQDI